MFELGSWRCFPELQQLSPVTWIKMKEGRKKMGDGQRREGKDGGRKKRQVVRDKHSST